MKKLLLCISILTSYASFAQSADISVNMSSPANGATITGGTAFNLSFVITNNGPNSIRTADSVLVLFTLGAAYVTSGGQPLVLLIPHGVKAVGDTIMTSFKLTFGSTPPAGSSFCTLAVITNGSNLDPNAANNKSCATVNGTAAIDEITKAVETVNVYPNPAVNELNIFVDVEKARSIEIIDISGKTIEQVRIADKNTSINTSQYSGGIYFYRINDAQGNAIKTGKFNVNK